MLGTLGVSGWLVISATAAQESPPVATPPAAQILSTLKKEHPRLLAKTADFNRLRGETVSNVTQRAWATGLRAQAQRILGEPASKYEIPDGLRLLATSRRVLQRMQTLALLYRLDGDRRYVDRAWKELEAAAAFKDWNPRHFLDTAEMTHAFAIGYDWLYDQWTPEQRSVLRQAMIEKGIKLANDLHTRRAGFTRARHNWNQVCNGGIGMGALALADEEPALCGQFLEAALKSIQLPMVEFGPDGAWAEGPGYWGYATTYNVVFLAALESALGTDFGLPGIAGFSEAGMFPIHASGPTGLSFDYADAHASIIRAPQMYWFARKFNQPAYAVFQRRVASSDPLNLIYYDPRGEQAMPAGLPLDKHFRNADVVMMRSAWDDPNALWAGFKAGDNKANHSNLDLGGFVLEALGQRFAVELGADDYNMPAYFGNQRWTYYRLRAEGHNTLVINPSVEADQDPRAVAAITRFESKAANSLAIADLTAAYRQHAQKVQRGLAMLDRKRVLVQDEVEVSKPSDVWWFMHTPAQVRLADNGRAAELSLKGKELRARILAPAEATFSVMNAAPLPSSPVRDMQNKNKGIQKLAIHLGGFKSGTIAVILTPGSAEQPAPAIKPLSNWRAE
jgi:hypothetical protein